MTTLDARQGAGYWYTASGKREDDAPDSTDAAAAARTSAPAEDTQSTEHRDPPQDGVPATSIDVLNALRTYRTTESDLRRRLSQQLSVNETDLSALRYMFGVWQSEEGASPKELALALGISSASTTLVIDRLEKAGFIRRRRHPIDRRAVILEPGDSATDEFRDAFDIERRGVLAAADALTEEETETVTRFLRSMERTISEAVVPGARPAEH